MSIADEDLDGMLEDLEESGGTVVVEFQGCHVLAVPSSSDPDAFRGIGATLRGHVESVVVKTGALEVHAQDRVKVNGVEYLVAGPPEAIGDGSTSRIDLAIS